MKENNFKFITKRNNLEYLPINEWSFTLEQHTNAHKIDNAASVREALNDLTTLNGSVLKGKLLTG